MTTDQASRVSDLLAQIHDGSEEARNELIRLVYEELRGQAASLMRSERPDHTLQPTALLNEALRKLLLPGVLGNVPNRRYFFGAAVRAMRQVLVDHGRQRRALKRGKGSVREPLDTVLENLAHQGIDVVALHDALDELAQLSERQSEVVMLRFFGGLSMEEIADQLGVSLGTVEGDWRIARNWLRVRLGEEAVNDP